MTSSIAAQCRCVGGWQYSAPGWQTLFSQRSSHRWQRIVQRLLSGLRRPRVALSRSPSGDGRQASSPSAAGRHTDIHHRWNKRLAFASEGSSAASLAWRRQPNNCWTAHGTWPRHRRSHRSLQSPQQSEPCPKLPLPCAPAAFRPYSQYLLHGVAGFQHLRKISTRAYSGHTCAGCQPHDLDRRMRA